MNIEQSMKFREVAYEELRSLLEGNFYEEINLYQQTSVNTGLYEVKINGKVSEHQMKRIQDFVDKLYLMAYKDGYNNHADEIKNHLTYFEGLNIAWDYAREIITKYTSEELKEIFGEKSYIRIIESFTIDEVIEKLVDYKENKEKEENPSSKVGEYVVIDVGDDTFTGIVLGIDEIGCRHIWCPGTNKMYTYDDSHIARKTGILNDNILDMLHHNYLERIN